MNTLVTAKRTFQMLENESLWNVAEQVHRLLADNGLQHAVVGGVAVCLHGYRRNTVDLDLLIRASEGETLRRLLVGEGIPWHADEREFRTASGVAIQLVIAGEPEGKGQPATFPDPGDAAAITMIEGLPVLTLSQLVQAKLACGLGDLRRTHKDFADVVELIAIHKLDSSFARRLHKSVRKEFRLLVKRVTG